MMLVIVEELSVASEKVPRQQPQSSDLKPASASLEVSEHEVPRASVEGTKLQDWAAGAWSFGPSIFIFGLCCDPKPPYSAADCSSLSKLQEGKVYARFRIHQFSGDIWPSDDMLPEHAGSLRQSHDTMQPVVHTPSAAKKLKDEMTLKRVYGSSHLVGILLASGYILPTFLWSFDFRLARRLSCSRLGIATMRTNLDSSTRTYVHVLFFVFVCSLCLPDVLMILMFLYS